MARRIVVGLLLTIVLSACNSTERRWAAMCAEPKVGGNEGQDEREMCRLGEYATEAEKRQILDIRDAKKDAEARVKETEEEGRRKGFVQ